MNQERIVNDIIWNRNRKENALHNQELRPDYLKRTRRPKVVLTPIERLWERNLIERMKASL